MLISIISTVVVLALLIIVHEAGHFAMAKRLGVRVLRFSIGYPPRIFGIRRGETDYAIGATPFGGYVKMLGDEVSEGLSKDTAATYLKEVELDLVCDARALGAGAGGTDDQVLARIAGQMDGNGKLPALGRAPKRDEALLLEEMTRHNSAEEAIDVLAEGVANQEPRLNPIVQSFMERSFPTQSLVKRFAIVAAGPLANIAFAPILMIIVCLYGIPTLLPIIGSAKVNMPAYAAGLHKGDHVLAINGHAIATWGDFSQAVKDSEGHTLKIEIEREQAGATVHKIFTVNPVKRKEPVSPGEKAEVWVVGVLPRGDETVKRFGPIAAVSEGFKATERITVGLVAGLADVVDGSTPIRQALGGPIMIAQLAGQEARAGFADLMMFTVMLSLELGIINLLPIPMLDGGHLAFFVFEGLRGKPLKLRHREMAMQMGLLLLVALMAFVIFNDISRIIQG